LDPITDFFQTMQIVAWFTLGWKPLRPGTESDADAAEGPQKTNIRLSPQARLSTSLTSECFPRQLLAQRRGHSGRDTLAGGIASCSRRNRILAADNPRTRVRSFCEVAPRNGSQVISYGGGGVPTTIISGWFRICAPSVKPLARLLPPLILVKADQAQSLALHTTLNMLASELAEMPGSICGQPLADLCSYTPSAPHRSRSEACKSGLLRAIFDRQIGVALKSMHQKVDHPWTSNRWLCMRYVAFGFAVRFKDWWETPLEY